MPKKKNPSVCPGSFEAHENLVDQILIELSKNKNIRVWKNRTGFAKTENYAIRFGLIGSADITGIAQNALGHGLRLEIEVKTGNARQTTGQINFMQMIRDRGGIYIIARDTLAIYEELIKYGVHKSRSPTA